MLITNKGTIQGSTIICTMKDGYVWKWLLVCKVSPDHTDEELIELFNTNTVEDSAIERKWLSTEFVKVDSDEQYKYVWLSYTAMDVINDEYEQALNILGVETRTDESEVEANA